MCSDKTLKSEVNFVITKAVADPEFPVGVPVRRRRSNSLFLELIKKKFREILLYSPRIFSN